MIHILYPRSPPPPKKHEKKIRVTWGHVLRIACTWARMLFAATALITFYEDTCISSLRSTSAVSLGALQYLAPQKVFVLFVANQTVSCVPTIA